MRALYIEDNPDDVELVRASVSAAIREPIEIAHAILLSEALDDLWRTPSDVVLLDLSLPDATDLEALETLRRHFPAMPVVVLTGRADVATATRALQAGAQDYLVKGQMTGDGLERAVRYAIGRKRAERRLDTQHAVARILAEARHPAEGVASELLRTIVEGLGWSAAELWLQEPEGRWCREGTWGFPADPRDLRARQLAPGDGVIGRVAASGAVEWSTRRGGDPEAHGVAPATGFVSRCAFAIGPAPALAVVSLFSRREEPQDEDLLRTMAAICHQVGQFLERRRAERSLLERTRMAELAAAVSVRLTRSEPLAATLAGCAEAIGAHLEAAMVRVWTLDVGSDALVLQASAGVLQHVDTDGDRARIPLGEHAIGRIAAAREPHVTNDLASDPWSDDDEWTKREGLVSFAGLPLRVGGDLVGVVGLFARHPLSAIAREGLAMVADALALGIHRAHVEEALGRSEAQLRHSQKMEAMGRLAGGVAHDFNNLLSAIIGYSDLALGRLAEGDPLHREIGEVRRAGERAATLTRQLLAFSRRQPMVPRILDLNEVVRNMESLLRRLIGTDVELLPRMEPRLGPVRADPGQIEQVIMNLAVNARDAMPGGGRLTIETASVERLPGLGSPPGPHVLLALSDTGHGMDAEVQSHMFEPFFTTKPVGAGTGLGLSVAYGIVKQAGGYLVCESEIGRGTTFRIYLPRAVEPEVPAEKAAMLKPVAGGSETILLVDDESMLLELVREILEATGYRVIGASSGAEALAAAEGCEGRIDLLLTDILMPGMNGRELARRLLERWPSLRVLYMTGYAGDSDVAAASVKGGENILAKPFAPRALARRVREALDLGRHVRH